MARTRSSGVTAELCQATATSNSAPNVEMTCSVREIDAANMPAQWVWSLRCISLLQIAVLVQFWPAANNVATTIILLASIAILVALSTLIRPTPDDAQMPTPSPRTAAAKFSDCPNSSSISNMRQVAHSGSRRNKAPVRVAVAPVSAPHAVLARGLDPAQLVWADLMARMSHDLRTPLNAVIGFSDLMQREAFGPLGSPRYQEYARHIQDCGAALLKSTEDTLAMTSAMTGKVNDKPKHKPVELKSLANEAWQTLSPKADSRSISLILSIDADLEVHCDRIAMRQVLLNLMEEAMAHAPAHGQIFVQTVAFDNTVSIEVGTHSLVSTRPSDTLPMCIARTLLHFHHAQPIIVRDETTGWLAVTELERATQTDFFAKNMRQIEPTFARTEQEACAA